MALFCLKQLKYFKNEGNENRFMTKTTCSAQLEYTTWLLDEYIMNDDLFRTKNLHRIYWLNFILCRNKTCLNYIPSK